MNVAISRERNMCNEVVVAKFLSKTPLDDIMKRTPSQKPLTTRWVLTEKVEQENLDNKAKLIIEILHKTRTTSAFSVPGSSSS